MIARLGWLGFDVYEDIGVQYAIERARERILNDINCTEVPAGLRRTFIDMACGVYLRDCKAMGLLKTDQINFASAPASEIKEGDVTIRFASDGNMTPEARFDSLVGSLLNPNPLLLARYRRLVW